MAEFGVARPGDKLDNNRVDYTQEIVEMPGAIGDHNTTRPEATLQMRSGLSCERRRTERSHYYVGTGRRCSLGPSRRCEPRD